MLGSMLAGSTEGGGEKIEIDGKEYVEFYGMSSKKANEKHNGGLKDYRTSEGRRVAIPYKGPMEDIVQDILGVLVEEINDQEMLKRISLRMKGLMQSRTENG